MVVFTYVDPIGSTRSQPTPDRVKEVMPMSSHEFEGITPEVAGR